MGCGDRMIFPTGSKRRLSASYSSEISAPMFRSDGEGELEFTLEEAITIGEEIGIDWHEVEFTPESFLAGLEVELEHGTEVSEETNITDDDPNLTGQIAWVHLIEDPDYYELLDEMESEFDGVVTEASTRRRIINPRRYAYVLDDIVAKHPDYISPEVEKMAMDFIKRSERSAKSLADDEEEFIDYLKEVILAGPQFGNVASQDLVELLIGNPVLGAIPLADLKAEELIRSDKIDVYDYLQAALQHLVERVSLLWLEGKKIEWAKEYKPKTERDEMETLVEKGKQQVGGSVRRFATVRINGQEY